MYFVDSRLDYRDPDEEAFWKGGFEAVDEILDSVGVGLNPEDDVIDIGCGVGRLTRALADQTRHVVGLDVSGEMLARARRLNQRIENLSWELGSGTNLEPLPSDSADLCFSHVVFQHIPDPEITLNYVRDMGRVLRTSGRAVFVVSTDPQVHRQRPSLRKRVRSLAGRAPKGGDNKSWLGSSVDEKGLRQAAADGGLEIAGLVGLGTQYTIVHAVKSR